MSRETVSNSRIITEAWIEKNKGLLHKLMRKCNIEDSKMREDLMQELYLAILEAERDFDSNKNVKFTTYAYWKMRGRLFRFAKRLADQNCVLSFSDLTIHVEDEEDEDEWIERAIGRAAEQVHNDASSEESAIDNTLMREDLYQAISTLPDEQRALLNFVLQHGVSVRKAAAALNIPHDRARSLYASALCTLRRRLSRPANTPSRPSRTHRRPHVPSTIPISSCFSYQLPLFDLGRFVVLFGR